MATVRYAVQYQTSDVPTSRRYRSLAAAERALRSARYHARMGGDVQGVGLVVVGGTLTAEQCLALEVVNCGSV
jgi:hypothetical protein